MRSTLLIRGDALNPAEDDLLVQIDRLDANQNIPHGWRVTGGDLHNSEIVRVVMRYEIEDEDPITRTRKAAEDIMEARLRPHGFPDPRWYEARFKAMAEALGGDYPKRLEKES